MKSGGELSSIFGDGNERRPLHLAPGSLSSIQVVDFDEFTGLSVGGLQDKQRRGSILVRGPPLKSNERLLSLESLEMIVPPGGAADVQRKWRKRKVKARWCSFFFAKCKR
jgi:hypothetical protein